MDCRAFRHYMGFRLKIQQFINGLRESVVSLFQEFDPFRNGFLPLPVDHHHDQVSAVIKNRSAGNNVLSVTRVVNPVGHGTPSFNDLNRYGALGNTCIHQIVDRHMQQIFCSKAQRLGGLVIGKNDPALTISYKDGAVTVL